MKNKEHKTTVSTVENLCKNIIRKKIRSERKRLKLMQDKADDLCAEYLEAIGGAKNEIYKRMRMKTVSSMLVSFKKLGFGEFSFEVENLKLNRRSNVVSFIKNFYPSTHPSYSGVRSLPCTIRPTRRLKNLLIKADETRSDIRLNQENISSTLDRINRLNLIFNTLDIKNDFVEFLLSEGEITVDAEEMDKFIERKVSE